METIGPNVAGTWYAAEPEALERQLAGLLDDRPEAGGDEAAVDAVIAPHAGFAYSGRVAAQALRGLRRRGVRRVLLLGPSHYEAFSGGAVPRARRYRTPLGEVSFDSPALGELGMQPGIRVDDTPFLREHSLEAEIPFLQRILGSSWRAVPVLVGAGSEAGALERVAVALRPVLDEATVLVVSSDFTHYGAHFRFVPFDHEVPERIRELDGGAIDRILALDGPGFDAYVQRTGATICGRAAISVLLRLLPPGTRAELLAYDTSGRMTGDWGHSVSYAALSFAWDGAP